ncbi:hypothetical protein LOTGIDRAFT_164320 [Lottia gigantea]|uniref:Uncharacterized protein n=1 Tax=Lottia gigantea TaxID=225164 RepID=V4BNH9_LOTGI|nr:hypothetical protein LOTGIDRAFT_164320 [Lottia gigantea]ESO90394.1 hypothetical protein LOTGIDRAFT_164320 [Lottia gigantea]
MSINWGIRDFPMLDMVRTQACRTDRRMPVDFTSYLLAASPPTPSTGFELLSYAFNKSSPFTNDRLFDLNHNTNSNNNANLNARRNGPLKSIIIKSDNDSSENSETSEESETSSTPISPVSPGRVRKQVSFADHKGMALAQVRFLTEPSDMPPRLNPQLLVSLTHGATAGVTDDPPLKLCFTQPASDYLEFRERLEKECVSLENVILKNYSVALSDTV